jgi:TPR repeat protein
MKNSKNGLGTCLLLVISFISLSGNAQGMEDENNTNLLKWDRIIQRHIPEFIEVDPSLPGFAEDPFCQEVGKNPNVCFHRSVSQSHEAQYLHYLIEFMEKGDMRAPYEIAFILRRKAGVITSQERFLKKASEQGGAFPKAICEELKEELEEIRKIPSADITQRVNVLVREKAQHIFQDIFLDDPENLLLLWREKTTEQHRLANELINMAAERGYPMALNEMGVKCENEGDLIQAKKLFIRAGSQNLGLAQSNLGRLLEREGDTKGADEQYVKAAETGDPSAFNKVASLREREGKLEEAKLICALVYMRLKMTSALFPLGRILEKEGRVEDAEVLYSEVLDNMCAGSCYGAVARLKELKELALFKLTRWFTLTSQDQGDADFMKALSCIDQYKDQEAEEQLEKAAKSGHPAALVERGAFMISSMHGIISEERKVAAHELFLKAHQMGYIPGSFKLAELKQSMGHKEEADALIQLAKEKGYPADQARIDVIIQGIVDTLLKK